MLYALINNKKVRPKHTGERAACPFTGSEMISKCGDIKIHHWAYKVAPEGFKYKSKDTNWYLEWKSKFDPKICEIMYTDKEGNKHIADIDDGKTVIQFQQTFLKNEEIIEKELFYSSINKNFIWVVDGKFYFSKCVIDKKPLYDFNIKYCTNEQKDKILEYYRGSEEQPSFSKEREAVETKFYDIELTEKNEKKIKFLLEEYQHINNKKKSQNYIKTIQFKSNKNIFSRTRFPIFVDISHIEPNMIYQVDKKRIITKDYFVEKYSTFRSDISDLEVNIEHVVITSDRKKINKPIEKVNYLHNKTTKKIW